MRTRGYAVTDEELEPGLIAVATPIRGYDGAVVAALSVSGPTTRMNRDGLPAVAGYCAEEAAALSAVLGYRQRGAQAAAGRQADHNGRRYAMTTEELLGQLYDETLTGNKPAVLELTNQGLAQGLGPETLLYEALIPSLEEVGARFERGDFFVPEMLIAGKAMAGALEILRPLLAETGAQTIGKIVMGTVKGDVHDIGKNLVNIMFEGAGFEVIDLGVQVAPEKFVDGDQGAQAGHRGVLRVPHHHDADVQGQHQRAEARPACGTRSSSWSAAPRSPRSTPTWWAPTGTRPTPPRPWSGPRNCSRSAALPVNA